MANYRRTGQNSDETDLQKRINQQRTDQTGGGTALRQTPMPSPVPASADLGKVQTAQATPPYPTIPSGSYRESDAVRQARQMLEAQMSGKPGAYQPTWQNQLDDILGKILNREEFSYDLNGDALYRQYKDQYTLQGRQAMMDTMGQAAALTGGYGNSYAQGVGQQTYQGYLQQLNDKIPELYQLALSKYQMEGDALMDQYALLAAQEEQEYGRYRDGMSDYYQDLGLLTDSYRDERNFAYGQDRDRESDRQWQAEFDEAKRRYDQEWEQKYGSGDEEDSGSGSYSGNYSGAGGGYDNEGYDTETIKLAQAYVGATPDGQWGPASVEAARRARFQSLSDVVKRAVGGSVSDNGVNSGKLTYSDVALTAAQMRQNGVPNSEIAAYINAVVYGDNYTPTTNPAQDLMELRAGYAGSAR